MSPLSFKYFSQIYRSFLHMIIDYSADYSAERFISCMDRIWTLTARYGGRSTIQASKNNSTFHKGINFRERCRIKSQLVLEKYMRSRIARKFPTICDIARVCKFIRLEVMIKNIIVVLSSLSLQMRPRIYIRGSVRWSVGPSVGPSIGWSVRPWSISRFQSRTSNSILGSVRPFVHLSVRRSVRPSVGRSITNELKSSKIAVFDQNCDR